MTPQRLREIAALLLKDADDKAAALSRNTTLIKDNPKFVEWCEADVATRRQAARELQDFSFTLKGV